MARVVNRMLRAGETPFLHVESTNARAIDVYGALGFTKRAEFPLLCVIKVANASDSIRKAWNGFSQHLVANVGYYTRPLNPQKEKGCPSQPPSYQAL